MKIKKDGGGRRKVVLCWSTAYCSASKQNSYEFKFRQANPSSKYTKTFENQEVTCSVNWACPKLLLPGANMPMEPGASFFIPLQIRKKEERIWEKGL